MYKGKRDWADYHGLNQEQGSPGKYVCLSSNVFPSNWILISAQSFAKTLNIPKARVIRISGIGNTQNYEIDNTGLEDKIEEIKRN